MFIFVVAGWLVSLCLHEFAHAYTAWRFGDHDVEARGYLTLNPLKYSHPLLSLGLPVLFIALGGIGLPGRRGVPADVVHDARQKSLVSLAGPAPTWCSGWCSLVAIRAFGDSEHLAFWGAMAFLAFLQMTAAVLNLLPIPGLDGYGALEPHLSPRNPARRWHRQSNSASSSCWSCCSRPASISGSSRRWTGSSACPEFPTASGSWAVD